MTGYKDLEPEDISSTASSSLPPAPLKDLTPHDAQDDVTLVTELSMTPALRSIRRTKPPEFYVVSRINANIFFRPWNTGRSRLGPKCYRRSQRDTHRIRGFFLLVQTGLWCMLSAPFEIKIPPGTQPIQSRPYRLNPKQADTILHAHLAAGLIQPSTCSW